MEILIRDISKEDADALEIKAKAAGADNRGAWLAEQLHNMAAIPERYAFRVHGQVGKGAIRRYSDHVNGTSSTFSNFNQDEADAMERASNFVRRNAPGDKERAYELLSSQFGEDEVFEMPV
jgi:hypothetical protein